MRVSLLGAASTRISVDVFHVPISKLYGSHDPYHLIALKEDGEHREPPANNHPQAPCRATGTLKLGSPAHNTTLAPMKVYERQTLKPGPPSSL